MTDIEQLGKYRSDGRLPNESRSIKIETGLSEFNQCNGSSRILQGLSDVVVLVNGPFIVD